MKIVRLTIAAAFAATFALAQPPAPQPLAALAPAPSGTLPPLMWTAPEDHRNMMQQLSIKALRPGPSGQDAAPNHANYDEATANPYPELPDVLTLKNGKKVTTREQWKARRLEIMEDFDREVLGRVPASIPKITWTVTRSEDMKVGAYPVKARLLSGHVDNSAYPPIGVDIRMSVVTPANATGPVPVMMMFGGGLMPGEVPPGRGGRGPGGGPRFGSLKVVWIALLSASDSPAFLQPDPSWLIAGVISFPLAGRARSASR